MSSYRIMALGGAMLLATSAATAQPVGVGVTKGSAVNQLGTAVAKIVSEHSDVQMRTQPMGGSQQYIDQMDAGQLEFGMVSTIQFAMNYHGTQVAKGNKRPNMRIVATLVPFNSGLLTPRNSGIKTTADLKGRKVSWGFSSAPVMQEYVQGLIVNGGLSPSDVEQVPAVGLAQGLNYLKSGKVDATMAAVGAGHVKESAAAIDAGVRFISLSAAPAAVKAMHRHIPGSRAEVVQPAPNLPGIPEPITVLSYDYMLCANKDVPAATVEKVVKALAENIADLKATGPLFRNFEAKIMPRDQELPYHDGATAYYKKAALWHR